MKNICTDMPRRRQAGFTLIELMVIAAVIGILASIAYPSYQNYVLRSHRAAAQSEMMAIANHQQQFFLANRQYAANLTALNYTIPPDVSARYTCATTASNNATPPTFAVACTAIGAQASDGNLGLSGAGVKTPASKW